jgi:hypothetical protein
MDSSKKALVSRSFEIPMWMSEMIDDTVARAKANGDDATADELIRTCIAEFVKASIQRQNAAQQSPDPHDWLY